MFSIRLDGWLDYDELKILWFLKEISYTDFLEIWYQSCLLDRCGKKKEHLPGSKYRYSFEFQTMELDLKPARIWFLVFSQNHQLFERAKLQSKKCFFDKIRWLIGLWWTKNTLKFLGNFIYWFFRNPIPKFVLCQSHLIRTISISYTSFERFPIILIIFFKKMTEPLFIRFGVWLDYDELKLLQTFWWKN